MFVKELTSNADYFLVDDNFASINYNGSTLEYTFSIYAKLIQAMISGHDTIRISLIKKTEPKIKYFVGSSPSKVEISNIGFVKNVKDTLQKNLDEATIKTQDIEISSLLSDEIVGKIGSGIINSTNYSNFLPKIEQINVRQTRAGQRNFAGYDVDNFDILTRKIFQKFGLHPALVASIPFPALKIKSDNDGTKKSISNKTQVNFKGLLKNREFRDYYDTFYLKQINSTNSVRFIKKKAEYQKFNAKFLFDLSDIPLATLTSVTSLSIRLSLLKSEIETSSDIFRFSNIEAFEEATAGVKNIDANIITTDPKFVLPDKISVTNNENFSIDVTAFEYTMANSHFDKQQLDIVTLAPGENHNFNSTKIFFDASETRSYVLTSNKTIPGIDGVSNVLKILTPPEASSPPRQIDTFDIAIKPSGGASTSADIIVSGLSSNEYTATLYKQKIGSPEIKMLTRVSMGKQGYTDRKIQPGDVYVYTADLEFNGAKGYAKASTGLVSLDSGGLNRVSFSITDKSSSGTTDSQRHNFKIVESISSTAASKLLEAATESAEAGMFSSELEIAKVDTTVITSYSIYRIQTTTGNVEYLGQRSAGEKLRFSVTGQNVKNNKYEYIVLPRATAISSLSYTTVVAGTDIYTGNTYNYRYKKFRDKNFPRATILPSYSEVLKNDLDAALQNLPDGASESVTFGASNREGRVGSLSAISKENLDCTFLSWRYTGDLSGVSHFVIFAKYNKYKAPIGIAIPDENKKPNALYSYCDDQLGDVEGGVAYSILPILKTGHQGKESKTANAKFTKNYPLKALK
jgi:hypothetical protein